VTARRPRVLWAWASSDGCPAVDTVTPTRRSRRRSEPAWRELEGSFNSALGGPGSHQVILPAAACGNEPVLRELVAHHEATGRVPRELRVLQGRARPLRFVLRGTRTTTAILDWLPRRPTSTTAGPRPCGSDGHSSSTLPMPSTPSVSSANALNHRRFRRQPGSTSRRRWPLRLDDSRRNLFHKG